MGKNIMKKLFKTTLAIGSVLFNVNWAIGNIQIMTAVRNASNNDLNEKYNSVLVKQDLRYKQLLDMGIYHNAQEEPPLSINGSSTYKVKIYLYFDEDNGYAELLGKLDLLSVNDSHNVNINLYTRTSSIKIHLLAIEKTVYLPVNDVNSLTFDGYFKDWDAAGNDEVLIDETFRLEYAVGNGYKRATTQSINSNGVSNQRGSDGGYDIVNFRQLERSSPSDTGEIGGIATQTYPYDNPFSKKDIRPTVEKVVSKNDLKGYLESPTYYYYSTY